MTDRKEFIRIWESSCSTKEVADKCGVTTQAAYARASRYRVKGVPLKRHGWEDLAEYTKSLQSGEAESA